VKAKVQHRLKQNEGLESPHDLVFVDTETLPVKDGEDKEVHNLRLGVACHQLRRGKGRHDTEVYFDFTEAGEFWSWLESKARSRARLWCFAHNLAFDFMVLDGFTALQARGWVPTKRIIGNPPIVLDFVKQHRTIRFCDSVNYFPMPLADVGKMVGILKLPMPDFSASDAVWAVYCRRDVEVLKGGINALIAFLQESKYGGWAISQASIAFNIFRHTFMSEPIYIHANKKATALERAAYFGGRVECFFIGKAEGEFYQLDVNSMYPAVMRDNLFPTNLVTIWEGADPEDVEKALKYYLVVGEVELDTPKPLFPVRHDGRVVFPVGRFTATLATPEFALAWEKGYIREVKRLALYDQGVIFREYVDILFKRRREFQEAGNKPFAEICKRMLNSLYGKFGQKGADWEKVGYIPSIPDGFWTEVEGETGKVEEYRALGGLVEVKVASGESYNSFPAIAAHVTSYARLKLLALMDRAGKRHVYYSDSDSVIVDRAGFEALKDSLSDTELGMLKVENKATSLVIFSPKDYIFGGVVKTKGISKGAFVLREGVYRQPHYRGFLRAWRMGDTKRAVVDIVIKEARRVYEKGIVGPDGWTLPLKANGYVYPLGECSECGERTQEFDVILEPMLIPYKAVGWVGGRFIDRDHRYRDGGSKEKKVCFKCLGRPVPSY